MIRRVARLLLVLAVAMLPLALLQADEAVPTLTRHVTDLTGTLTAQQVDQLDAQLVSLEKTKGAQLVVLMVPTTEPQDIAEYSLAVAEANKIGLFIGGLLVIALLVALKLARLPLLPNNQPA